MERYLAIAKSNLKFHLLPHALVAILLCVLSPLIMGLENLDAIQTAKIIEVFLSLLGIVLFVPLFIADDDTSIRNLLRSKRESMVTIHVIRLFESFCLLLFIVGVYLIFLKVNNCSFPYASFYYAALANAIFLGGLGVFIYGVMDLMPVAYMLPLLYYMMCFGGVKKYLGKFYLFGMMAGTIGDKKYLLIAGTILLCLGIILRDCNYLQIKHLIRN